MGWGGYGLYDGDETQTCHYDFMKWAGWKGDVDDCLQLKKTKLTNDMKVLLAKNIDKVLKKMPKLNKFGFRDSQDAIEWQMLLSLFFDNKLLPPKIVFDNGVLATKYLLEYQSKEFDNPAKRKAVLRSFIKRVTKLFGGIPMK
jgi:hypothetical protein